MAVASPNWNAPPLTGEFVDITSHLLRYLFYYTQICHWISCRLERSGYNGLIIVVSSNEISKHQNRVRSNSSYLKKRPATITCIIVLQRKKLLTTKDILLLIIHHTTESRTSWWRPQRYLYLFFSLFFSSSSHVSEAAKEWTKSCGQEAADYFSPLRKTTKRF